jgi:hypothetical protein
MSAVLSAAPQVLEPLADPSSAVLALGPLLLGLQVLPLGDWLREHALEEESSLARRLAAVLGLAAVPVSAVALVVVGIGVPRAAVGLPTTPPSPLVALLGGGLVGVVVFYQVGALKRPVYGVLGRPDGDGTEHLPGSRAGWVAQLGLAMPAGAVGWALLACGAVAALVAGHGLPPAGAVLLVLAASAGAAALRGDTDRPTLAIETLVDAGLLAAFVLTGNLALVAVAHLSYDVYTLHKIVEIRQREASCAAGA